MGGWHRIQFQFPVPLISLADSPGRRRGADFGKRPSQLSQLPVRSATSMLHHDLIRTPGYRQRWPSPTASPPPLTLPKTSDGMFQQSVAAFLGDLARLAQAPPLPRDFDHICKLVEEVGGVRFSELFAACPKEKAADGRRQALQMVSRAGREKSKP